MGNMRGVKEDVYARLRSGMEALFGDKYELFLVEEPARSDSDAALGEGGAGRDPRVSLVLVRRDVVNAAPPGAWQYVIALVLLGVTGGACLELGLATQVRSPLTLLQGPPPWPCLTGRGCCLDLSPGSSLCCLGGHRGSPALRESRGACRCPGSPRVPMPAGV